MSDVIDPPELLSQNSAESDADLGFSRDLYQILAEKGLSKEAREFIVPRFQDIYQLECFTHEVRCEVLFSNWPEHQDILKELCEALKEASIQHLVSAQELLIELAEAKELTE